MHSQASQNIFVPMPELRALLQRRCSAAGKEIYYSHEAFVLGDLCERPLPITFCISSYEDQPMRLSR
jgi:hypothetical protein